MTFFPHGPVRRLPIIPASLLRAHRVLEKSDTRFRACARLLQAIWREQQQLPIGLHLKKGGGKRPIGSLISTSAAAAGRNFLSPRIAEVVRHEVVYRQLGALIDQRRLFANLVSSAGLAFNLFAPLRLNGELAANAIRYLIPGIGLARVLRVQFEHSPGRRQPSLTNDQSAFDIAITFERHDGRTGFIGIEQKYTETGHESPHGDLPARLDELAHESGLYKNPALALLRVNPLQQLFREHLLAQASLMRGDHAEAHFMLVAPRANHNLQQAANLYSAHLDEPVEGQATFINVELEKVIEAIGCAGELDYAYALHDRFCAWDKVDDAVEQALRAGSSDWHISPPARARLSTTLAIAA